MLHQWEMWKLADGDRCSMYVITLYWAQSCAYQTDETNSTSGTSSFIICHMIGGWHSIHMLTPPPSIMWLLGSKASDTAHKPSCTVTMETHYPCQWSMTHSPHHKKKILHTGRQISQGFNTAQARAITSSYRTPASWPRSTPEQQR